MDGQLLVVFLMMITTVHGTALMKRKRGRQNADDAAMVMQQDRNSVQEVLLSIDDRLARLDTTVEQLARRLDSKLGRLETKFDLRMSRVEEAVNGWELTSEQVSRRLDALGDKVAQRTAHLDLRAAKALSRLDSLERDLHSSVDEILDRLVKGEEKSAVLEAEVGKVQERTVALGATIGREMARHFDRVDMQLGFWTISNWTPGTAHLDLSAAKALSRLDSLERDLHSSVDEILDRLVNGKEKSAVLEAEVAKVQERTVALGASIGRELARNFDRMDMQVVFVSIVRIVVVVIVPVGES
ncbi:hypothetical protein JTE90_012081 [Oedothorax gibbosus]|uniref:Uncharacterized protein n=1 Tax=Oedothorax gibbosus TaxID=931172 RepID=A0AAV6TLW3_9ARAC|nr:hypothetical protein JTE90_012081 [Oedothorax gibbosus]